MSDQAFPKGPLSGIRVLDLSRVLTGPFCTMILADLGAEVVKLEEPGSGDQTRTVPPFVEGESHYYMAINRNKRSIVVDLKSDEGREIARGLARQSDVLIENFRPGVMARLGLDYEKLQGEKPELIICSITGFGQEGPMAEVPSFDLVTQALSGIMSINGEADGPPTKMGVPMGDVGGGLWAAIAVLAALQHRTATGKGLHVDLSLLDGLVGLLGYLAEIYLVTGESPGRVGSGHHSIVPYGRYPVKDGHIVLALHVGPFWRKFCQAVGHADLIENPKFKTTADRQANREELEAIVVDILAEKTAAEWGEFLRDADIPSGPVLDIGEALRQPSVAARGLIKETDHPAAGKVEVVGSPIQYKGAFEDEAYAPSAILGQHTETVLSDLLGYDKEQLERLKNNGVIE
ncbi:MAG TPA: CoA transferase [Rhodospirillaceae bacterium]|nr:CoA transferase [Rhodospirillaceae bacterium]HAT35129.1 CoA transferase [Rhodospirillaceae bacterium]